MDECCRTDPRFAPVCCYQAWALWVFTSARSLTRQKAAPCTSSMPWPKGACHGSSIASRHYLQLMYLRERLSRIRPGRFVEMGPGGGEITRLLLSAVGPVVPMIGVPPRSTIIDNEVCAGELQRAVGDVNDNYLARTVRSDADLVISSMVMEHMDEDQQFAFMTGRHGTLRSDGRMIGLVPASPRHWGIEDDIAGHCRRYTRSSLRRLTSASGWRLSHTAGLTFPISNCTSSHFEFLVHHKEARNWPSPVGADQAVRPTQVKFKTHFPPFWGLVLNSFSLPAYMQSRNHALTRNAPSYCISKLNQTAQFDRK